MISLSYYILLKAANEIERPVQLFDELVDLQDGVSL